MLEQVTISQQLQKVKGNALKLLSNKKNENIALSYEHNLTRILQNKLTFFSQFNQLNSAWKRSLYFLRASNEFSRRSSGRIKVVMR